MVGGRRRRVLGDDLAVLRRQARGRTRRCSPTRSMPGARWFPGAELSYAEHIFRGKDPRGDGARPRLRAAPARRRHLGRAPRAHARGSRPGCASLGVGRGDRVVAYLPNIEEATVAFLATRQPRRDLVVVLARLRRAGGDRPVRPDRAEGAARRRRLPLRRQGLRPARRRRPRSGAGSPSLEHTVVLPYLGSRRGRGRARLGRTARARSRRRARVRAAPVRPPALGALLVGHDRPAEVDRPRPGRDPARVPEDRLPAPRPAGRATASSGSRRPAG